MNATIADYPKPIVAFMQGFVMGGGVGIGGHARAAAETYEQLGSPEGELALANAVIYLATAPKSNAVYKAYNEARAFVKKDGLRICWI